MQIGWIFDSDVAVFILYAQTCETKHSLFIKAEVLLELYQRLLLYLLKEEFFLSARA